MQGPIPKRSVRVTLTLSALALLALVAGGEMVHAHDSAEERCEVCFHQITVATDQPLTDVGATLVDQGSLAPSRPLHAAPQLDDPAPARGPPALTS